MSDTNKPVKKEADSLPFFPPIENNNTDTSPVISTSNVGGMNVGHYEAPGSLTTLPESAPKLDGENGPAGLEGNGFGNCVVSWFKDAGTAVREMLSSVAASISSKFSAFFGSLTGMFSALRNAFSFSETAKEDEETAVEQPTKVAQPTEGPTPVKAQLVETE
ncbi:hypothetical protein [Pseudochelatococcus sp. G4_1912]|uniref:hypothetical protein n=1 Tax=Pseudochelatococcus sp. G4_1912 TaxID=3114288 RepID=UPI0039C7487E